MPLERQLLPIPFSKGIDTKSHDWVVPSDRLMELENGVFTKLGAIVPRNGFVGLTTTDASGSLLQPIAVATRKKELVALDGRELYSYSESTQTWIGKGALVPCLAQAEQVIANTYDQINPSVAALGSLALFAWEDSRGGVRYTLRDVANDTNLASDVLLDHQTTAQRPSCVAFDNKLLVAWWNNGSIRVAVIHAGSPQNPTVLTPIDDAHASEPIFDLCAAGDRLFFFYKLPFSVVKTLALDTSFNVAGTVSTIGFSGGTQVCATALSPGHGMVAALQPSNIEIWGFKPDGSFEFNLLIAAAVGNDVSNLGFSWDQTSGTGHLAWQVNADKSQNCEVKARTFTSASFGVGVTEPIVTLARSAQVISRPFTVSGSSFVTVVHNSPLQPSAFFVDISSKRVVGSALTTEAGAAPIGSGSRPSPVCDLGGPMLLAAGQRGQLVYEEAVQFTNTGIAAVQVDTAVTPRAIDVDAGLHIAAGQGWLYDGANVTEHGFLLWPESPTYQVVPSGGDVEAGLYLYAFTYEWTDNLGKVHRSASSVYQTVTVPTDNSSVVWSVPTLRLTAKSAVRVVGYRSQRVQDTGGDSLLQRFTSVSNPTINDTSIDSVFITDDNSDEDIATNDVIYNAAMVPDNDAVRNVVQFVSHKSRVFAVSSDGNLYFSKYVSSGAPVQFSVLYNLTVPSSGGDLVAAASLDDNLLAFRQDSIYIVTGEGPTDANTNNDYGVPGRLTSDVGCTDPDSILVVPQGAMFKSRKGLYTMDRGQSVEYTGAPVEAYNGLDIKGVVLIADKNQVRFLTEGPMLVYDYFAQQWSTFTPLPGLSSTLWKERHAFVRTTDGRVLVEDSAATDDAGRSYTMKLVTAWIQPAGFQALLRLYRLQLLGRYVDTNEATISLSHDFNPAFAEVHHASGSVVYGGNVFGSDSPFGSGSPYGGSWDLEQLEVRPTRQKCQSFRVKVEIEPAVGCELLGIAATAASKGRDNTLPTRKRI